MPAVAETPQQQMFPGPDSCYARVYTADHLAKHPEQRVTRIAVSPDARISGSEFALTLNVTLRGAARGTAEATG